MSKDLYEVYKAVSQEGEVLYVGYGKRGRHTHCMSGICDKENSEKQSSWLFSCW